MRINSSLAEIGGSEEPLLEGPLLHLKVNVTSEGKATVVVHEAV